MKNQFLRRHWPKLWFGFLALVWHLGFGVAAVVFENTAFWGFMAMPGVVLGGVAVFHLTALAVEEL